MTLSELNKCIEEEVSAVVQQHEVVTEPVRDQPKRPQYKPVLKTEDEIDEMLFWAGKKPKYIKKYRT